MRRCGRGDTVEEITVERAAELLAEPSRGRSVEGGGEEGAPKKKAPAKKAAAKKSAGEEGRGEEGGREEGAGEEDRGEEGSPDRRGLSRLMRAAPIAAQLASRPIA